MVPDARRRGARLPMVVAPLWASAGLSPANLDAHRAGPGRGAGGARQFERPRAGLAMAEADVRVAVAL